MAEKVTYPDWSTNKKLFKSNFGELVRHRQAQKAMIKKIEEEIKEINDAILVLMIQAKVDRVQYYEFKLRRAKGSNSRVDPKMLLAKGVKPGIIKACTVKTEYEYVDVRESVEEEEEEDGRDEA